MKDFLSDFRRGDRSFPRPMAGFDPDRMPPNLRRLMVLSIVVSVLFASIFVWSDKGLGELRRLDRRAADLKADITLLAAENGRLGKEIDEFPNRKLRVERLARE